MGQILALGARPDVEEYISDVLLFSLIVTTVYKAWQKHRFADHQHCLESY